MSDAAPQTPIVIFDEFLVSEEWRRLLDFTFSRMPDFMRTQVIGSDGISYADNQTRRSHVLFDVGPYHQLFIDRLMAFFPHVLARLNHQWFPVRHVEVQLTGTGNGEFFRMHTDDGADEVKTREITFVYFFYREPRPFSGGELRIYDTYRNSGRSLPTGPYRIVYPLQNQVVFFPSGCLHEILPVGCPSGDFADSRFTINGWLHR
jgi:Rps23 Pro-64 3,4-dihydroxylase Tpa1-like proline 4-hydroxylase